MQAFPPVLYSPAEHEVQVVVSGYVELFPSGQVSQEVNLFPNVPEGQM